MLGGVNDLDRHSVSFMVDGCPFSPGFEKEVHWMMMGCLMKIVVRESNQCRKKIGSAPWSRATSVKKRSEEVRSTVST